MDAPIETIWRFVRGDLPAAEFERWIYAYEELEEFLGTPDYLALITTDFRDRNAVSRVRQTLDRFARSITDLTCECISLPETAVLDMGNPGRALETLREEALRGEPHWWLSLSRCTVCNEPWLVAQEERQNDVFVLRRLTQEEARAIAREGQWPSYLDSYHTLLRLGRQAGHRAVFLDPVGDSSLAWTMTDLARERPGITVPELAALLNLDLQTAAIVADQAIILHGASIDSTRDVP